MNPTVFLAPSGNIGLEIPSVLAEGRSHTVEIPLSISGLSLLKKILTERSRDKVPSIGKMSSPVASEISSYLEKKDFAEKAAAKRASQDYLDRFNIELDL